MNPFVIFTLHHYLPYDMVYHTLQIFEAYKHTKLHEIHSLVTTYASIYTKYVLWNNGTIQNASSTKVIANGLSIIFDTKYFAHKGAPGLAYMYIPLQKAHTIRALMRNYILLFPNEK
jgi:hypothetical protein